MEDLATPSSTHIRRVQFSSSTRELRVALAEVGQEERWYSYRGVPVRHFQALRDQEMGARKQGTGHAKGHKPYSVGTYYNDHIKGKFGERRADGPLVSGR
jgi:hypothetical protein